MIINLKCKHSNPNIHMTQFLTDILTVTIKKIINSCIPSYVNERIFLQKFLKICKSLVDYCTKGLYKPNWDVVKYGTIVVNMPSVRAYIMVFFIRYAHIVCECYSTNKRVQTNNSIRHHTTVETLLDRHNSIRIIQSLNHHHKFYL